MRNKFIKHIIFKTMAFNIFYVYREQHPPADGNIFRTIRANSLYSHAETGGTLRHYKQFTISLQTCLIMSEVIYYDFN